MLRLRAYNVVNNHHHVLLHDDDVEACEYSQQELVHQMFDEAVQQEIEWSNHILDNHILGINEQSTEKYTKFLANMRIKMLGFDELYEGYDVNPYAHLEKLADENNDGVKSNFFESTVTNYSQSSSVDDWDDF